MEMIHLAVFMIHLACVLIHECYTLQVFTVLRKNQIKPLNQRENYFAAYVLKDATYDSTVRAKLLPMCGQNRCIMHLFNGNSFSVFFYLDMH